MDGANVNDVYSRTLEDVAPLIVCWGCGVLIDKKHASKHREVWFCEYCEDVNGNEPA